MSRVIHLSTTDKGGAGQAAFRIHKSLLDNGIDSKLIVKHSFRKDDTIFQKQKLNFIRKVARRINKYWSVFRDLLINQKYLFFSLDDKKLNSHAKNWLEQHITGETEVVFIHWVAGFINFEQVEKVVENTGIKVYVMLMDMAPFTGGCHFSYGCKGYEHMCFNCPATSATVLSKKIRNNFSGKAKAIMNMQAVAISSSKYVLDQAKESAIPFFDYIQTFQPVDVEIFTHRPLVLKSNNTVECKRIFMGAYNKEDERKGYQIFVQAIFYLSKYLVAQGLKVSILIPENMRCNELNFPNIILEKYKFAKTEIELAQIYNSSHVFVNTSIDDSGPLMISEALFCGVPIVASDVGCANELVSYDSGFGKVVSTFDCQAFAEAIIEVLFEQTALYNPQYIEKASKQYYSQYPSFASLLARCESA